MPKKESVSRPRILQILTCYGSQGQYGGPARVSREQLSELASRGNVTNLVTGLLAEASAPDIPNTEVAGVRVKPLVKQLPYSSLWGRNLVSILFKQIRLADTVHIHFARDLIPFSGAVIAKLLRKKLILQTHGMIIKDGRISTQIIDFLFTRPLLRSADKVLVLSHIELRDLRAISEKPNFKILGNGIGHRASVEQKPWADRPKIVVFCSRLHKRKRIDIFIEIATLALDAKSDMQFEISGPDAGELAWVQSEITSRALTNTRYIGALQPNQVQNWLAEKKLLVLPSDAEPYPMIVLEAFSVNTPALVMADCGLAPNLKLIDSTFVIENSEPNYILKKIQGILFESTAESLPLSIQKIQDTFSIDKIVDQLEDIYEQ